MLELIERDGLARIGILNTNHGEVITPALMPVINPNLLIITPREMQEVFGTQIVITNSYIIHKKEELIEKALKDGVHGLLDFSGAIMTDSGTFQSHVYGDVDVNPNEIVEFQKDVGSDIGTILDLFSEVGDSEEKVKQDVEGTIKRAEEAVSLKGDMALACTIQGGNSLDLRRKCAEELSRLDCDVHPIGSVVPLMENYRFRELVEIIIASKKGLNPSRPVHLFGCGHPMLFGLAVLLGCDMFDSASYAKYAKDGRLLFPDGTRKLEEIVELPCGCPVCSKYHVESIKEMFEAGDTKQIAMHNLYVSFTEIKRIRQAIHEGSLWEFVEERCRTHPDLLSALKTLKIHKKFLERYEPASRNGAFFYTGPESMDRPIVYRYEKRFFERYRHPKATVQVGFEEGGKPYSRFYRKEITAVSMLTDAHFIVNSAFGPVPIELDEMYPIAQSVIPDKLEPETVDRMIKLMERHSHKGLFSLAVMWDGDETLEFLRVSGGEKSAFDLDILRIKAVADMQFGRGAQDVLFSGEIDLVKSKKTGKIRNVISDGKHILSMRAGDGLFTLKLEGAKKLHKVFDSPKLRVVVEDDSVEFNREGKNVFAKFVVDCDEELRPRDEVLIVDKKDELVAVGRAVMNREEMLAFYVGIAVKVREGIEKGA
ncbi:MAG: tRNA-guanine transglycosylase [Nitrospira bacterium SG8_3]|nr:MAG: tRNA-guanine transglycosylase [Nitrospira bacterium SG8_3]